MSARRHHVSCACLAAKPVSPELRDATLSAIDGAAAAPPAADVGGDAAEAANVAEDAAAAIGAKDTGAFGAETEGAPVGLGVLGL